MTWGECLGRRVSSHPISSHLRQHKGAYNSRTVGDQSNCQLRDDNIRYKMMERERDGLVGWFENRRRPIKLRDDNIRYKRTERERERDGLVGRLVGLRTCDDTRRSLVHVLARTNVTFVRFQELKVRHVFFLVSKPQKQRPVQPRGRVRVTG